MISLSVSIVSFNTKDLLRGILKQLEKQRFDGQIDIWVLDNNSSDNSAEMVESEFPTIHLIKSAINSGFAAGHNQILKKISSDLVLILNPDVKIPSDAISKMVKFILDYPKCAIASCKINYFSGKESSNGGDLPLGLSLLSWLFNLEILGVRTNFHRDDRDYYTVAHEVGWVSGTLMIARTQVLKKLGYFDENYFMYFEDTQLCYKAKKAGYSIMINPDLTIEHASGASSIDPRFKQWSGEFGGLIKFYENQFGFIASFFVRILVYLVIVLRMIAFSIKGNLAVSKTYGKVLFSI